MDVCVFPQTPVVKPYPPLWLCLQIGPRRKLLRLTEVVRMHQGKAM